MGGPGGGSKNSRKNLISNVDGLKSVMDVPLGLGSNWFWIRWEIARIGPKLDFLLQRVRFVKASSEKEEIKRIYVGVYTVFKVVTQRTIQSFLKDCNLISTQGNYGGKKDSILLLNIDMYVFKPNIVKITSPLSLFAIERTRKYILGVLTHTTAWDRH